MVRDWRAFAFMVLSALALTAVNLAAGQEEQSLVSPSSACSESLDEALCLTGYIAERLYQAELDRPSSEFVQLYPVLGLLAFFSGGLMLGSAVFR